MHATTSSTMPCEAQGSVRNGPRTETDGRRAASLLLPSRSDGRDDGGPRDAQRATRATTAGELTRSACPRTQAGGVRAARELLQGRAGGELLGADRAGDAVA